MIAATLHALKAPVIGPSETVRVMVATKPVDLRKNGGETDPFSGAVYVFRAKRLSC
jgi:transposase